MGTNCGTHSAVVQSGKGFEKFSEQREEKSWFAALACPISSHFGAEIKIEECGIACNVSLHSAKFSIELVSFDFICISTPCTFFISLMRLERARTDGEGLPRLGRGPVLSPHPCLMLGV